MKNSCGLDFGTSNSSIGYTKSEQSFLTQFSGKGYIPSAIFFDLDAPKPLFGNVAIERYVDGCEGRMIWSPKNALGTSLISEKTRIKSESVSFKDIIQLIIKNLKDHCEAEAQSEMQNVVCGRPVFFNDDDPALDRLAQQSVSEILKNVGFKNIEFEFEPIAAAIHYERMISNEQIALIVDMGGGTSDFTVTKLVPGQGKNMSDRSKHVLSVGGIHIAGTDFDKQLSLNSLMPELGLGCQYKSLEGTWFAVPPTLHRELATWHKIGFQYTIQNISWAKSKVFTSDCPTKFERLLHTLQYRQGHYLARLVEQVKIDLSTNTSSFLRSSEVKPKIDIEVNRDTLESSIENNIQLIGNTVKKTIYDAGVLSQNIDAVFMTGGSSLIPAVRRVIATLTPKAKVIEGDKFGSVAHGLTLAAHEKFGVYREI